MTIAVCILCTFIKGIPREYYIASYLLTIENVLHFVCHQKVVILPGNIFTFLFCQQYSVLHRVGDDALLRVFTLICEFFF